MRLESLEETVTDIQRTLYGNSRERNGGGLYGLVMKSSRRLDEVERRTARPPGWLSLIIVGGVASLLLHLITLAALVAMLAALNGG